MLEKEKSQKSMALQLAMQQQHIRELEEKHRQGYLKHPVAEEEFSIWEDEQEKVQNGIGTIFYVSR